MTPPFVIFALPRSRTNWLSFFLSYGGWSCAHEEARHVRGVEDVRIWLSQERVGAVETAAAPFWRLLLQIRPDARIAVVRRPVAEVVESLIATGTWFDRQELTARMEKLSRKLDRIERMAPNVVSVRYADMEREETCARLFEHCLGLQHDHEWWARMAPMNLQIDLAALLRYLQAYAPRLRAAEAACVRRISAGLRGDKVRLGPVDERGVSIQEECAETVYRDAQALFREHCAAVGEPEDEWTRKNLPLMFQMADGGFAQCVTARSNGRVLAYLMTLVVPSLEAVNRVSATQTMFFSSRDALGMNLGESLQRASIERLRARGVYEVLMREGVRGSGPKLGVLYRRLGAEPFGNLHRLHLGSN